MAKQNNVVQALKKRSLLAWSFGLFTIKKIWKVYIFLKILNKQKSIKLIIFRNCLKNHEREQVRKAIYK